MPLDHPAPLAPSAEKYPLPSLVLLLFPASSFHRFKYTADNESWEACVAGNEVNRGLPAPLIFDNNTLK